MGSTVVARWREVTGWYARRHYTVLFASLLLTLVVAPVVGELKLGGALVEALLFLNLMAAVVGVRIDVQSTGRLGLAMAATLGLLLALRAVASWLQIDAVANGATLLWAVLAAAGAVQAVRFAMGGRTVDQEHVFASLSAYLLAGHIFGAVYWRIGALFPGAYSVGASVVGSLDLESAIYYSFVTLATLGYGDIVPVTPVARGLAVSEAILGQLYLAVLVARLIGAFGRRD